MWQVEIKSKEFANGTLSVNVSYSNGTDQFNEVYNIRAAEHLDPLIKNRVEQLESLSSFSLPMGTYTLPTDKPVVATIDPFKESYSKLSELKSYVDLGIIPKDDPDFLAALQDAKDKLP